MAIVVLALKCWLLLSIVVTGGALLTLAEEGFLKKVWSIVVSCLALAALLVYAGSWLLLSVLRTFWRAPL